MHNVILGLYMRISSIFEIVRLECVLLIYFIVDTPRSPYLHPFDALHEPLISPLKMILDAIEINLPTKDRIASS